MDTEYRVKVEVANSDDIIKFATSVLKLDSFKKLTDNEKLKILVSYPLRLNFKQIFKVFLGTYKNLLCQMLYWICNIYTDIYIHISFVESPLF